MSRLIGLLEASGNVYINITPSERYISGYQTGIGFSFNAKSEGYLNTASVLFLQNGINSRVVNNKLIISQKPDLKKLIEYTELHQFQNELRKREFVILKECLEIQENGEHITKKGLNKLHDLKQELSMLKGEIGNK